MHCNILKYFMQELYYAELSNEEDNLKQVLDMRLKLNKALSEEALQLESKLLFQEYIMCYE